jgi:hypothetical protein
MQVTAMNEASEDAGEAYNYLTVPLWYRLAIAVPLASFAVAISLSGMAQAWRENSWLPLGWAWPLWMAVGLPLAWGIYKHDTKKEYATVRAPVPPLVRQHRYVIATGVALLFLIPLLLSEQFSRNPVDVFLTCICPLALAYVGAVVTTMRHTTTKVFTRLAVIAMQEERANLERASATPAKPSKAELLLERVAAIWWVRYLFGLILLAGAYVFAMEGSGRKETVIIAVALGCWGAYCMREVFAWLVGAAIVGGIIYAIAGAVAGIPVSVAIIIGAIIIANSKK